MAPQTINASRGFTRLMMISPKHLELDPGAHSFLHTTTSIHPHTSSLLTMTFPLQLQYVLYLTYPTPYSNSNHHHHHHFHYDSQHHTHQSPPLITTTTTTPQQTSTNPHRHYPLSPYTSNHNHPLTLQPSPPSTLYQQSPPPTIPPLLPPPRTTSTTKKFQRGNFDVYILQTGRLDDNIGGRRVCRGRHKCVCVRGGSPHPP